MKKKELEMILQTIPPISNPKPSLEQYSTPASIAADVLHTAFTRGDIAGRRVIDLGCGNGVFAIGAYILGARYVVGVEMDEVVLREARENALALGVDVDWIVADVGFLHLRGDTVIQNPPFGAQKRRADRKFLKAAIETARTVYSLHMAETVPFLERYVADLGATVELRKIYKFYIPRMFSFHRKEKKSVEVVMLLIRTSG